MRAVPESAKSKGAELAGCGLRAANGNSIGGSNGSNNGGGESTLTEGHKVWHYDVAASTHDLRNECHIYRLRYLGSVGPPEMDTVPS